MDLDVPPMPMASCIDANVFDAWSWCASDVLEWRRPLKRDGRDGRGQREGNEEEERLVLDAGAHIEIANPPGLVFVMREGADNAFLPSELARLHAFGYGLEDDERALAPWAIDDATDLLYEHRVRPRDALWLAADGLEALVWGLHDWAHFHNHGPFDQPALTELQCDLVALAWLRRNAARIGIDDACLVQVARDLATLSQRRFVNEGIASPVRDLDALFLGPYPSS